MSRHTHPRPDVSAAETAAARTDRPLRVEARLVPSVEERLYKARNRLTILQALMSWQGTADSAPRDMHAFWGGVDALVDDTLDDVIAVQAVLHADGDQSPGHPLLADAPDVEA